MSLNQNTAMSNLNIPNTDELADLNNAKSKIIDSEASKRRSIIGIHNDTSLTTVQKALKIQVCVPSALF